MSTGVDGGVQFRYRRPVCPFISSTFEDFQAERDILVEDVFPEVDALCRQRGTYCAPIDLRWTEKDAVASSSGVVRLCLDYVTRAAPFFVCLIGERYGLHRPKSAGPLPASAEQLAPDADWMDRNLVEAAAGGHDWLLQPNYQHHSLTELQIVQAVQVAEAEHTYFYFRQPDHTDLLFPDVTDEAHRRELLAVYEADSQQGNIKVRDLKARIVKKGLPVKYFNSPDELARLVLADWTTLVNRLYPPIKKSVGAESQPINTADAESFVERVAQETFAESRRRVFVETPFTQDLMNTMSEFAVGCLDAPERQDEYIGECETFKHSRKKKVEEEPTEPRIMVLLGDRGCGKTSLIANWVQEFSAEQKEIQVICHHVTASARSGDVSTFMQHCAEAMRGEKLTGWDEGAKSTEGQDSGSLYALTEVFAASLMLNPSVIVLDSLDGISGSYGLSPQQLKELSWLPTPLPAQCRVIVTTVPSDLTYRILDKRHDTRIVRIPTLTDAAVRSEILDEHITNQCKYIGGPQLKEVMGSKLAERPLFLALLAQELRVLGVSQQRVENHLESYLLASSIRDLWNKIMKRWVNDYSWQVYNPLAAEDENQTKTKGYAGWVSDVLRLIAVSKNGLSPHEILVILKKLGYHGQREVSCLAWAQFQWAAQGILIERPGGLLSFSHKHIQDAVEYVLLGAVTPDIAAMRDPKARIPIAGAKGTNPFHAPPFSEPAAAEPTQKAFHQHLANYFTTCPHGERRTDELPWQLEMSGNMEELRNALSEPRLFFALHGDSEENSVGRQDLFHYWKVLKRAGHDPSETYRQMIQKISDCHSAHKNDCPELENSDTRESSPQSIDSMETPSDVYAPLEGDRLNEHQKARLYRVVAVFLKQLGYSEDADDLLTMAYSKLYESYPLGDSAQHLLFTVESGLGCLHARQGDSAGAAKWYNKALFSIESLMEGVQDDQVIQRHTQAKGKVLERIGHLKLVDREYTEAERFLKKSEECMSNADCAEGKATVHYHLGSVRLGRGQFVEAEMMFRQAIETREHLYGKSHPIVAEVLDDLASLLCHPENQISYERYEADALFRRALRIREMCLGPDHLLMATTLFHLGKLLKSDTSSGGNRECLQLLRRSLDIRTTKLGADHPDTLVVRRVLSAMEAAAGGRHGVGASHHQTSAVVAAAVSSAAPDGARPSNTPRYSSMTWHDTELLVFQQRERAKVAEAARLKATRPPPSRMSMADMSLISEDESRSLAGIMRRRPSIAQRSGRSIATSISRGPSSRPYGGSVESFEVTKSRRDDPIKSCLSVGDLNTVKVAEDTTPHVAFPDLEPLTPREEDEHPSTVADEEQNLEVEPLRLVQRKPRPLSNYGRRSVPMTYVKFTENHPALKVAPSSATSKAASSDYLDSYAPAASPMPQLSGRQRTEPIQAKLVLRISRPRTDPNKLYRRYAGTSTGSTGESSDAPEWRTPAPPTTRSTSRAVSRMYSAKSGGGSSMASGGGASSTIYRLHRQQCYIPGRHSNDIHNAYSSTKGPNSSLVSLLGEPEAPRDVFLQVCHKSAWYHVPGRYSTVDKPYPPKRSQKRPGNDQSPSSGVSIRLAKHNLSGYGSKRSATVAATVTSDNASQHSWDSRSSVPVGGVGGGGGGMIDSWMT